MYFFLLGQGAVIMKKEVEKNYCKRFYRCIAIQGVLCATCLVILVAVCCKMFGPRLQYKFLATLCTVFLCPSWTESENTGHHHFTWFVAKSLTC